MKKCKGCLCIQCVKACSVPCKNCKNVACKVVYCAEIVREGKQMMIYDYIEKGEKC